MSPEKTSMSAPVHAVVLLLLTFKARSEVLS